MAEKLLVVGNLAKDVYGGQEHFGGCAANLALGAMRLGLDVSIMSVLGKDPFSQKYRKFLTDNGINVSQVRHEIEEIPVCEVVSTENQISSSIWHDNNCHPAMDGMEVDKRFVESHQITHLVCCPPGLAKRITQTQASLSYEPGPMLVVCPDYFDLAVAEQSQLVFMNREEYETASRNNRGDIMGMTNYRKLAALVVTLGKDGADVYKKQADVVSCENIPAIALNTEVVDPVGAGDNFKAGFLAAYMKGKSVEESVQIGAEMGAACVIQQGALLPDSVVKSIKSKYKI